MMPVQTACLPTGGGGEAIAPLTVHEGMGGAGPIPLLIPPLPPPPAPRTCQHALCNTPPRWGYKFCFRHGGGPRCSVDGCNKAPQGASGLCSRHGGARKCKVAKCNRGARMGSDFCASCAGGSKECMSIGCTFKQRKQGLCKRCHDEKQRAAKKEKKGSDAAQLAVACPSAVQQHVVPRWCTVFPALLAAMRRAGVKDTSGVLEVSLTEKIGLRVARSSLAMLAATCKAMQAAIRQIERHPFKRGDTLMLITTRLPHLDGKKPATRLKGHLDEMFIRVNKVCPDGRMLRVQKLDWAFVKNDAGEDEQVVPHVPRSRKRRRELAAAETHKRVRRTVTPVVGRKGHPKRKKRIACPDATTAELNAKCGVFYVEYAPDPESKLRYGRMSQAPRLKELEARL